MLTSCIFPAETLFSGGSMENLTLRLISGMVFFSAVVFSFISAAASPFIENRHIVTSFFLFVVFIQYMNDFYSWYLCRKVTL